LAFQRLDDARDFNGFDLHYAQPVYSTLLSAENGKSPI
jgi:hypothetical protein